MAKFAPLLVLLPCLFAVATIQSADAEGNLERLRRPRNDTVKSKTRDPLGGRIEQRLQEDSTKNRRLEKTLYTANYLGRVRMLIDLTCSANKPKLKITCQNGGTLEILRLGHTSLAVEDQPNDSEAVVGSDCADRAACERVFVSDETEDDSHADIFFQCSGDYVEATAAYIETVTTEGNVECTNGGLWGSTRAFYIAQLGVFCPPPEGSVSDGSYLYNSQFFECKDGSTLDEEYTDGRYTCYTGHNCNGISCTKDEIETVSVHAELPMFQERCVTTSIVEGEAVSQPPQPAPFLPPVGDFTVRHQALWAFQFDDFWCGGTIPEMQVKCLDGGTIGSIEKLNEETECTVIDDSTMVCEETCASCDYFVSPRYSGVSYECIGPSMAAVRSEATYLSSSAYCTSSFSGSSTPAVAHRLRLGLYCGTAILGGEFEFSDKYSECEKGNLFNQENGEGAHFECLEYEEVPLTGGRVNQTLEDVVMKTSAITEEVYELMRTNDCFKATFAPTAPTPVVRETSSPTVSVSTPAPTPSGSLIGPSESEPTFAPQAFCLETCNCIAS